MKKSFVAGALVLALASLISKVLGAIFRIPLTSLIRPEGIGIYQLVFPIYALFLIACSAGIPVALSKIISQEISNKNEQNIKIIFKSSLFLVALLGSFFTLLIIILSKFLAYAQSNVDIYICYIAIAPAILFSSLISAFRGYFQGQENMKFSAISQILEQLFKLLFGLLFAYIFLKKSLIMAVVGAVLGVSLSELLTLIYLIICYKKEYASFSKVVTLSFKDSIKKIIKISLPITLNSTISPIVSVVDSLIIVKLLKISGFGFDIASTLYGLESGVVASLISLPSVISVSLAISLMPSLSSSFAIKNMKDAQFKSKLGIKIVWYLTLPCAIIFFLLSKEICYFLYGNLGGSAINQLEIASELLKIGSVSVIYISINQILTTILQAVNKSYIPVINLAIFSILKIALTVILVSNQNINIYGLVISDVVCFGICCIINLYFVRKSLNIKFDLKEIFLVPFFSLSLSIVIIFLLKFLLKNYLFNRLIILGIILIGFLTYGLLVLLLKGFNNSELNKTKFIKFFKNKKY